MVSEVAIVNNNTNHTFRDQRSFSVLISLMDRLFCRFQNLRCARNPVPRSRRISVHVYQFSGSSVFLNLQRKKAWLRNQGVCEVMHEQNNFAPDFLKQFSFLKSKQTNFSTKGQHLFCQFTSHAALHYLKKFPC